MKKTKAETCYYNLNRHSEGIVLPWCSWAAHHRPKAMPPHVYWGERSVSERTCAKCQCFVETVSISTTLSGATIIEE